MSAMRHAMMGDGRTDVDLMHVPPGEENLIATRLRQELMRIPT